MSYRLFLDDVRDPSDVKWIELPLGPWVIVRSYDEFVKKITKDGLPSFVTFDHDLADEHYPFNDAEANKGILKEIRYDRYTEKTGYHCAQWLVDYCLDNKLKLPNYTVHSWNSVGKKNIHSLLFNFKNFQSKS